MINMTVMTQGNNRYDFKTNLGKV